MNDKYLVTKANALITARYNLSVQEQRIILTLVSLVQPDDKELKVYRFKIANFVEMLGLEGHSKYNELMKITRDLVETGIQIKEPDRTLQMTWLASADYKHGEGIIELELSEKLKPYLLDVKRRFTTYQLENAIKLSGMYSIRLYEILKSYEFIGVWEVTVIEFSDMFKLPVTYSDFFNLRKRVLEPSQKEINEKTDIAFDYETVIARKKVIALKFNIKPNQKQPPQQPIKQLKEPKSVQSDDIESIKNEFRKLYKGELVDRFAKQMLEQKGLPYIQECLWNYKDYIDGQDIKNIGGHFYTFVMEGYEKPVQHKGKVSQRDNFDQREYSDEELENCYANFQDEPQPSKKPYEQVKGHIDNMRNATLKTDSEDSIKGN